MLLWDNLLLCAMRWFWIEELFWTKTTAFNWNVNVNDEKRKCAPLTEPRCSVVRPIRKLLQRTSDFHGCEGRRIMTGQLLTQIPQWVMMGNLTNESVISILFIAFSNCTGLRKSLLWFAPQPLSLVKFPTKQFSKMMPSKIFFRFNTKIHSFERLTFEPCWPKAVGLDPVKCS